MKIELKQAYKSIKTLTAGDLPDFAVLIGRNGAGKTQLLDALVEGQAHVPGIEVDVIEKYDIDSFRPSNTSTANRSINQFAQSTADAYLSSPAGELSPIHTAAVIFDQCARDIECQFGTQAREAFERDLRYEIGRIPDFTVFAVNSQESQYKQTLFSQVLAPLISRNSHPQGRRRSDSRASKSFNGNRAALISAAMRLTSKLPHELTRGDILRASHGEGNTLLNSISEVFVAYKSDQFILAHKRIEEENIRFGDLMAEYRSKNPPPWEALREILSDMRNAAGDEGLFDFSFTDPETDNLRVEHYEQYSFRARMTNQTTGEQYELDSLSSGEKILMTLCLVSFNQYLGRPRPELLLLDEVDALLHPSMVRALVRTLKTLFVAQGTKVLMTSHSPMTVAALDEADILRVVRSGGDVKVSPTTKAEAIRELSEGLATVDVVLRTAAYEGARVTLLSEGNNAKHLKRWIEVMGLSEDVHVFEELGQHTNDEQLLAYGRLLAKVDKNTHFVVVWDCDAGDKAVKLGKDLSYNAKVTPYAFPKREDNKIAKSGIENNYNEDILEPYSTKTTRNDGTVLNRGFDNSRKTEFANHVMEEGTLEYFNNFQDLYTVINCILGSSERNQASSRAG